MLFCEAEFLVAVLQGCFPGQSVVRECNVEVQVGEMDWVDLCELVSTCSSTRCGYESGAYFALYLDQ
jgi:hypothetical protein